MATIQQNLRPGFARLLLACLAALLGPVLLLAGLVGPAFAGTIDANLDQCRNGQYGSPAVCDDSLTSSPLGWVNGNANAVQAHWAEGESIAYRTKFTSMLPGQYAYEIQYDFTNPNGKHAIDYLTTYTRTETLANACTSVLPAAACAQLNKLAIPMDPVLPTCTTEEHAIGGVPQEPGEFYLYGGATLDSVSYVGTHACEGDGIKVNMVINFTVPNGVSDVVLAWGGHIAGAFDWGRGRSASAISGSPYHMAQANLKHNGSDTGIGQQDRQLMAAAVFSTEMTTQVLTDGQNMINHPITETVTLTGYHGASISTDPVIAGTVNVFICADNTLPFEPPFANGCDYGQGTFVGAISVSGNGTYTGPTYTPTRNGYYCFRSEFLPEAGSAYPTARETNAQIAGQNAECVLLTDPNSLTLVSLGAHGSKSSGSALAFTGLLLAGLAAAGVYYRQRK